MQKIEMASFSPAVLADLPHNTKLEFHTSSRTRKFVQAWVIDRSAERPVKVYATPTHLFGWFDMEDFANNSIRRMTECDPDYAPVTEVRIYQPAEWK